MTSNSPVANLNLTKTQISIILTALHESAGAHYRFQSAFSDVADSAAYKKSLHELREIHALISDLAQLRSTL